MTAIDDAYYQNDFVRQMALIGQQLAADIGAKVKPHKDAHDDAVAKIAALDAAGHSAPADLSTSTDTAVQAVRDDYEFALATANANLALDSSVQSALGVIPDLEAQRAQVASEWLAAIDAVWTPAGGST